MELVPAPLRQFKTWSMLLLIVDGLLNLAGVMINSLSDAHYISAGTFGIVNIAMGFLIGAVRLVKQQVTATTEEKTALIEGAVAQPITPGHKDVTADVQPVAEAIKPLAATQPSKLSGQDARDWIVKEVRLQLAEALKPKPRKPRKKAPPPPDTGGIVRAP